MLGYGLNLWVGLGCSLTVIGTILIAVSVLRGRK